jgi:GT2 family glycosyltransferase
VRTTILLLSVDEAPMLERSLPAAVSQDPAAEVVVIDNGCTDATAELAARHGARRLRIEPRRSYAAAINEAIAGTGGDAVLLLNADCFLRPGFLAAALPRLAEPGVGSVAPKLLRTSREPPAPASAPTPPAPASPPTPPAPPPTEIDAAGMFIDRRRKNGLVGHGRPAAGFGRPAPAFGADGAAALYRRRTLEDCALGGREVLDEDMGLWASDADLAWRAQLRGWACVYEPRAVAEHVRTYSPSTRSTISPDARRLQFRNRYLMMLKNETAGGLTRDLARIGIYEVLAFGHVLLRERHLLGGYRDAWRLRAGARRRRRLVQASPLKSPPFGLRAPE